MLKINSKSRLRLKEIKNEILAPTYPWDMVHNEWGFPSFLHHTKNPSLFEHGSCTNDFKYVAFSFLSIPQVLNLFLKPYFIQLNGNRLALSILLIMQLHNGIDCYIVYIRSCHLLLALSTKNSLYFLLQEIEQLSYKILMMFQNILSKMRGKGMWL